MSTVVIQECKSYELEPMIAKINAGIELLGGWDRFVKPGMKVLLKVNLLGPKPSDSAAITNSEFVRAVIRILVQKQCTVWVGDSSGGAIPGRAVTGKSFTVSGLEKVALEEGAEIKNFDREGVVEAKSRDSSQEALFLAKPMFEADVVINLPKFKTHMVAAYTGAIKNLYGCIPGLKKAEYHKSSPTSARFGEVLADINQVLKVDLHIVDGITAMEGQGPTAGNSYPAHKLLMGTDALALDTVACKMINLAIEEIPFYKASIERKLGEYKLERIHVKGDYTAPPVLPGFKTAFKITRGRALNLMSVFINFMKARPNIDLRICKRCNVCVDSCPVKAIEKESKRINYKKCIECMCCHELCMYKAVELKRVNALADLLIRRSEK